MDAAQQVAQIVHAAEEAADQLRAEAETRSRERIAEAQRAAGYRVQAAEEEAAEILAAAKAEAAQLVAEGRKAAEAEAAKVHAEAAEVRASAREEARTVTSEARLAAREVLEDGSELSTDLRDLASSLRANAERLLRDIRLAHASMTARLDQATPGAPVESDPRPRRPAGELDVPEFVPGR